MSELTNVSVQFLNELKGAYYTLEEYRRIFYRTSKPIKFESNIHTSSDFGAPIGRTKKVRKRYFTSNY